MGRQVERFRYKLIYGVTKKCRKNAYDKINYKKYQILNLHACEYLLSFALSSSIIVKALSRVNYYRNTKIYVIYFLQWTSGVHIYLISHKNKSAPILHRRTLMFLFVLVLFLLTCIYLKVQWMKSMPCTPDFPLEE